MIYLKTIENLNAKIMNCRTCSLGSREKQVVGKGPLGGILLIGEAPGPDEEVQREPFIGRSGQKLRAMIREYLDISDQDIRITNAVHCRPIDELGKTRTPSQVEIISCNKWLQAEIEIVQPKLIITVGRIPLVSLFGKIDKLANYRNKVLIYKGYKVISTYHPAAVLRNKNKYEPLVISDFEYIKEVLLSVQF